MPQKAQPGSTTRHVMVCQLGWRRPAPYCRSHSKWKQPLSTEISCCLRPILGCLTAPPVIGPFGVCDEGPQFPSRTVQPLGTLHVMSAFVSLPRWGILLCCPCLSTKRSRHFFLPPTFSHVEEGFDLSFCYAGHCLPFQYRIHCLSIRLSVCPSVVSFLASSLR